MLCFVFGSVAYMALREDGGANGGGGPDPAELARADVAVYFFDADIRCSTCLAMEAYTKEVLETRFSAELASGSLVFYTLNMERPENEHHVDEFKLFAKSVVVVELEAGAAVRHVNLEKIWELAGDKPGYFAYLEANIREYLGAPP